MAKIISTDHLKTALKAVDENKMDYRKSICRLTTANNYPYHRIASRTSRVLPSGNVDNSLTLYISQNYTKGHFGILRVDVRDSSSGPQAIDAEWLVRKGFDDSDVKICACVKDSVVYYDIYIKSPTTYKSSSVQFMSSGARDSDNMQWKLIASYENGSTTANDKKDSYECWKTVEEAAQGLYGQAYKMIAPATDVGVVENANKVNGHTVEADIPAGGKEGQVLKWVSGAPKWADA